MEKLVIVINSRKLLKSCDSIAVEWIVTNPGIGEDVGGHYHEFPNDGDIETNINNYQQNAEQELLNVVSIHYPNQYEL